jgi:hypothetical protein
VAVGPRLLSFERRLPKNDLPAEILAVEKLAQRPAAAFFLPIPRGKPLRRAPNQSDKLHNVLNFRRLQPI